MTVQKRIAAFKEVVESQIELLEQVAECQHELRSNLMARNWPHLDLVIRELERISDGLERLESRRFTLQCEIGEERVRGTELGELCRRLKMAVVRVQSDARGIRSYTETAIETTGEVLQELFPPDTEGQYARDGGKQRGKQSALILDHTL